MISFQSRFILFFSCFFLSIFSYAGYLYSSSCQECGLCAEFEWLYLHRNNVGNDIDFTSFGVVGPIVLSSENLGNFDWEPAYRGVLSYHFSCIDSIEVSYMQSQEWSLRAQILDGSDNLFSTFSDFGFFPLLGFPDSDQAFFSSIRYKSNFYSAEAHYRKRTCPCTCFPLYGSLFGGFRYFRLDEKFTYEIQTTVGSTDYRVMTCNDLYGLQLGGDINLPLFCDFLTLGAEIKGAVYINCAEQRTRVDATTLSDTFKRDKKTERGARSIEATGKLVYQRCPYYKVYVGYTFLYFDKVALALDNFNATPTFFAPSRQNNFINTTGHVSYHGSIVGFEWCF